MVACCLDLVARFRTCVSWCGDSGFLDLVECCFGFVCVWFAWWFAFCGVCLDLRAVACDLLFGWCWLVLVGLLILWLWRPCFGGFGCSSRATLVFVCV